MTDKVRRRLTTLLCADAAGYTRLMGADEAGKLATLIERRLGGGRGHAEPYRAPLALQTDLGLHLSDKIAESPPQA